MEMQWEDPSDLHPDVILAADVLYDPGKQMFTTDEE